MSDGPHDQAGDRVLAEFRPDRLAYVRNHMQWAAMGGVLAVVALVLMGRADTIWAAVMGVLLAMVLRGAWLYRDVMRTRWLLTEAALIGPGQRIERAEIAVARPVFGGVAVVTRGGRKVLIQYLADPAAAAAAIREAR